MKLSKVLLRIRWMKPADDVFAGGFLADTEPNYHIPGHPKGLKLVGVDNLGTSATVFVLPDGQIHSGLGGTLSTMFENVVKSGTVDRISDDECGAWVLVSGEAVLRGRYAVEEWSVMRLGDIVVTDDPTMVIVLSSLQFLRQEDIDALESHMGQP